MLKNKKNTLKGMIVFLIILIMGSLGFLVFYINSIPINDTQMERVSRWSKVLEKDLIFHKMVQSSLVDKKISSLEYRDLESYYTVNVHKLMVERLSQEINVKQK